MNFEGYKFVAHRGLFNKENIPENSIKAFELCVQKGYAIELDVNMTKDGYLVVFHDTNLKRMTGIKYDVSELNLNEIKKIKLLGTENRIPTLEDVFLLVDGKVPLMIEIKRNDKFEALMPKLISMLDKYNGEYVVKSFDPRIVYWLKKNAPHITRGQLAAKNIREVKGRIMKFLLGKMFFNIFTKPHFISYQYTNINDKMYKKQKRKGRKVAVWTVKSKDEYLKIKDICDMVIFENEETIL